MTRLDALALMILLGATVLGIVSLQGATISARLATEEPRDDMHDTALTLPEGSTVTWTWNSLNRRDVVLGSGFLSTPEPGPLRLPLPDAMDTLIVWAWADGALDTTVGAVLSFNAQKWGGGSLAHFTYYPRVEQYVFREASRQPTEPTVPPQEPLGDYRVRPDFDANDLTDVQRTWHSRVFESMQRDWDTNPPATWRARAQGNNSYDLGRSVNLVATALLSGMHGTADPALLDTVGVLLRDMQETLGDPWRDGSTDGYLGWWWVEAQTSDYGQDTHHMDEALTHSWIAEAAYAFEVNRDLEPRWAEAADFWKDYLRHHFEAKWIARTGSRENAWRGTDGFYKSLWHPYSGLARMAHFFWLLYGDEWYAGERDRVLDAFRTDVLLLGGERYAWPHRVRGNGSDQGIQKTSYAEYTFASLQTLVHLGVLDTGDELAATCRYVLDQGGPEDMANRLDGSSFGGDNPITGLDVGPMGAFAKWDASLLDDVDRDYTPGFYGVYKSAFALGGLR